MYIYSVEIIVPKGQEKLWLLWMEQKHIPDLLATKCFTGYRLLKIVEDLAEPSPQYRVEYALNTMADYDRYISEFANDLRGDFVNHFTGEFSFKRNLLQVI